MTPYAIIKEGPPPTFQIMVANGQLENPIATVELRFEVGEIDFNEIFIVMDKLTSPLIGLQFLQRNHTILNMRQGILNFPYFSMQLKTADNKYSNIMEPIVNPSEIVIPPNDIIQIRTNSQIYQDDKVTGILQPSEQLEESGELDICAALITLHEGQMAIQVHNFTDNPFTLRKGFHIANFQF